MSLAAVSLLWGHMLGLVTWWALPITILLFAIGYGSEIDSNSIKTGEK